MSAAGPCSRLAERPLWVDRYQQKMLCGFFRSRPDGQVIWLWGVESVNAHPKKGHRVNRRPRSTTKIHALVDANGRPIRLKLTEGQAHDGRSAADMLETVDAGHILLADRAYDGDALRAAMAERGAWANIRTMPNRVKIFPFSAWVYRQRNAVERFFNKLKHFRAIATRYDKRDDNFLASVQLASIRTWLRGYESVT